MQYNAVNYKYVFELFIMNVDLFIIEEKLPMFMSGHVLRKKYDIISPYLYWYTLMFTIFQVMLPILIIMTVQEDAYQEQIYSLKVLNREWLVFATK